MSQRSGGEKTSSCCHFTRIKRITLPVGRIDSGPHSLPHLKNDAWVNPQTQEPLQVIQRQSAREWLALAMQTSQTQLLQRQQSLGVTWALGGERAESAWVSVGRGPQRTASAVSTRTTRRRSLLSFMGKLLQEPAPSLWAHP